jgi:hypothetical protein
MERTGHPSGRLHILPQSHKQAGRLKSYGLSNRIDFVDIRMTTLGRNVALCIDGPVRRIAA